MSAANRLIGVVNAGSSSLKFSLYDLDSCVLSAQVEGIGVRPRVHVQGERGEPVPTPEFRDLAPATPTDALLQIVPWVRTRVGGRPLDAIGHRVVHGGPHHFAPEIVTPHLIEELAALTPLAPLHQPHNISPIRAILDRIPDLPQVACFDTGFHHTISDVVQAFAIPYEFTAKGVRRYGFHGLSYEYIASALPTIAPDIAHGRVIVAHLGSGASLCALRDCRSVASTMGFSALDGLPMGTRCGELDPGVILYLLQHEKMTAAGIEDLLYRRSGVLGISGISSDFRQLLSSTEPRARFAIDVFVHRVSRAVGSLAACLGGLDGLIFTAGVGENAVSVRAAICDACAWLGLKIDPAANAGHGPRITGRSGGTAAFVIPTNENLMIARHTQTILRGQKSEHAATTR